MVKKITVFIAIVLAFLLLCPIIGALVYRTLAPIFSWPLESWMGLYHAYLHSFIPSALGGLYIAYKVVSKKYPNVYIYYSITIIGALINAAPLVWFFSSGNSMDSSSLKWDNPIIPALILSALAMSFVANAVMLHLLKISLKKSSFALNFTSKVLP